MLLLTNEYTLGLLFLQSHWEVFINCSSHSSKDQMRLQRYCCRFASQWFDRARRYLYLVFL